MILARWIILAVLVVGALMLRCRAKKWFKDARAYLSDLKHYDE